MASRLSPTIFNLPLFLREDIYDRVFSERRIAILVDTVHHSARLKTFQPQYDVYLDRKVPCPTLAIAQTTKMLRPEALHRFYKTASFVLVGTDYALERLFQLSQQHPFVNEHSLRHDKAKYTDKTENEKMLREHLDIVRDTIRNVERLSLDLRELAYIGLDMRSWTWPTGLNKICTRLKVICVCFSVGCCRCDHDSLCERYDIFANNQQLTTDDAGRADGKLIRKLVLNTPEGIELRFDVDLGDGCTAFGIGTFRLDPNREPKFQMVKWLNYFSTNHYLLEFLKGFELYDEATAMQKMMDEEPEPV